MFTFSYIALEIKKKILPKSKTHKKLFYNEVYKKVKLN